VLRYRDWDDRSRTIETATGRPLLLNLWASWCAPCVSELADLAGRRKEFRKRHLDVIALSVDGLGDDRASDPDGLKDFLRQLDFPYASGLATTELVDKLELLFARTFGRHVAFPVPTSFLFDANGRLAAIYLGQVETEVLIADLDMLDLDDMALRASATPFAGRWLSPPRSGDMGLLAREYLRAGYAEDAEPLLREEAKDGGAEPRHLLATALSQLDRGDEAETLYREALALDPASVRARYNYAHLLAADDRHGEAIEQLAALLRIDPTHANARLSLAQALVRTGRSVDALEHYRLALEARPKWGVVWNALIRQLAAGADPRVRDVPAAILLAERICDQTGNRVPELLDSLAVAYAAAGRFDEAVGAGRNAKELALAAERIDYAEEIEARVALFLAERAWTEPY
jgi:tetratricopeptide (TPR) repeat protein